MKLGFEFPDSLKQSVMEEYGEWYRVWLTQQQLEQILRENVHFALDVVTHGFDTCARENLNDKVCKYIGLDKSWPIGMTKEEEAVQFFREFFERANKAGVKVDEDFLEKYGAEYGRQL